MSFEDSGITYKVWWRIRARHTNDGYFYKTIEIHKGYKYCLDYWEAKEELEKINKSILALGLAELAETGIKEE